MAHVGTLDDAGTASAASARAACAGFIGWTLIHPAFTASVN
jgi:citrate lyase beta subunit